MLDSVGSERGARCQPQRRRWRVLAGLALLALGLHVWLLQGVASAVSAPAASPRSSLRVRVLAAPAPVSTPTETTPDRVPDATPRASRSPAPAPLVPRRSAAKRPAPTPSPAAAEPVALPEATAVASAASAPASASASAVVQAAAETIATDAAALASAASAASAPLTLDSRSSEPAPAATRASDDETPVYRTLIPPPLTLKYGLKRGMLSGSGELSWRHDAERYEARLEGKVAGVGVLTQVSQGGFDHAGLAPQRFTDQRLRGAARAANFQRERGEITFSGPGDMFALLVGTQDRLSWMIQLAAVASAEPQRLQAGGKVVMYVVGARADAAVWVFRSQGAELVDTEAGPVRAVKFVRESRKPYDTQVEAWLDPARHHLPVRARLSTGADGEALELLLQEMLQPP